MMTSVFGSLSVIASAENAVAQVVDSNGNATNYTTFEEAWKEVVNGKATFKLLSDCRVLGNFGASEGNVMQQLLCFNGGAQSVPPGYSVTMDLNGHKICRDKGVNNMTDDSIVLYLNKNKLEKTA